MLEIEYLITHIFLFILGGSNPDYPNDKPEPCQNGYKETSIEIYYCAPDFVDVRKCCGRGSNINPKGESCTDHLAKEDKDGQGFISKVRSKFPSILPLHEKDLARLDDLKIYRMKKEYLSVTMHDFTLKKTPQGLVLNYNNRDFKHVSKNKIIPQNN